MSSKEKMAQNKLDKKSSLSFKSVMIILLIIALLLIQLFAAPKLRADSSSEFTSDYFVYYLNVPTLACFLCGMAFGMLLKRIANFQVKKSAHTAIIISAVLLILVSYAIPLTVTAAAITETLNFNVPSVMLKILSDRFLSVFFIRFLPFLSGFLFEIACCGKKEEQIS